MADETSAAPDYDLLWRLKVNGPMSVVESFNGRTGVVVSQAGDYAASDVTNDSSVTGATVKAALNALLGAIPTVPVSSVFGRIGAIVAIAGDYLASQVANDSSVPGLSVAQALNALLGLIPSVPVSSVFGRIGAVVGQFGDYDASEVANDSSVSGSNVKDALNTLLGAIAVSSVFGRTGAVVANTGDYAANQVSNNSSVTGVSVKDALNTLLGLIPSVPVSSVFGRTGAVVAAAGDYGSTQVTNQSTVSGSTVTAALNTLLGLIPSVPVSSVFGRVGGVTGALGDYTSSLVTNLSSVSGATVTAALNTLLAAIPSVPVSSVFARTGAIVAVAGDYAASKITNDSSVTGADVKAALNSLLSLAAVQSVFTRTGAVVAAAGDYAASQVNNDSAVSGTHVSDALNTLNTRTTITIRDEVWDPPTTASADDDEFTSDTILSGGWNIGLAGASSGTPLTRDGAVDIQQAVLSSHYRSTCIGSTLFVQIRQNEQVWIWRQLAGALNSEQLWILGLSFPTEVGTANASDPGCSLQLAKQTGSIPDSANRFISQLGSSGDRLIVNAVVGGVSAGPVNSNNIQLGQVHGLALRINHGSAAAANGTGFGFNRSGIILTPNGIAGPQLNGATDKIVIALLGNTAVQIEGVNNVLFGLHFLRRVPITTGACLMAQP